MITLPYTYKLTHKETGQFYFGYRSANTVPAIQDLGIVYFTSSKIIRPIFNEFDYQILAEYEDGELAYKEEQLLIERNWENPLLLNRAYHKQDKASFRNKGHAKENRKKFGRPGKTQAPLTPEQRAKQLAGLEKVRGRKLSDEHKKKLSDAHLGRTDSRLGKSHSEETKKKLSDHFTGRPTKPFTEEHKKKLSDAAKLREAKHKLDNQEK